jgi:purine-binding chemotaxis protein CheW
MKDTSNSDLKRQANNHQERQATDWEQVRQRIAQAEAVLSKLDETKPEVLREIWTRRAQELAQKPVQEDQAQQIQLVLARLGNELYGLDAQFVYDIKPAAQITPVPRVPDWVAGVVNLRGRIFSIVDLQKFFGLNQAEQDQENHTRDTNGFLIVVEIPEMEVALLAQDVLNVESIPISHIQETTGTVRGLRPEYVRGVAKRLGGNGASANGPSPNGSNPGESKQEVMVVLDLPALLTDERLVIHEEIV